MDPHDESPQFPSFPFVFLVADLSGYARAFRHQTDEQMAGFLDEYYALAESVISDGGGKVIKFMGDSVLARFVPEEAPVAVAAAVALSTQVERLAEQSGLSVSLGANIHLGTAVEAELGQGSSRRLDVIGRAVNQAFLLGKGPGIRISEAVYRKLPSGERTPWEKNRPPAVYVLASGRPPYEGMGKTANENAIRW
jgi:class 3 adenylate cyclase